MTRHLASTRAFPAAYSVREPHPLVTNAFPGGRPIPGGFMELAPMPYGPNYLGMDPSAPSTWVRQWNPQPGMVGRLNFDGAKYAADIPMGGQWRNPMRDRADVGMSWLRRRK